EQVMRDDETADRVIAHHAPGIADDVCLASLQPEQILHVEPRVHARYHSYPLGRLNRLLSRVSGLMQRLPARVLLVVLEIPISHRGRHGSSSFSFRLSVC